MATDSRPEVPNSEQVARLFELSRRLTAEQWQQVVDRVYESSQREYQPGAPDPTASLPPERQAFQRWAQVALPLLRQRLPGVLESHVSDAEERSALGTAVTVAMFAWVRPGPEASEASLAGLELPASPGVDGDPEQAVEALVAALAACPRDFWRAAVPAALERHRTRTEEAQRQREEYRLRPEVRVTEMAVEERQAAGSDEAEFEGQALGALASALVLPDGDPDRTQKLDEGLALFAGLVSRGEVEAL